MPMGWREKPKLFHLRRTPASGKKAISGWTPIKFQRMVANGFDENQRFKKSNFPNIAKVQKKINTMCQQNNETCVVHFPHN
jgi:hypothetical protein